jgi:hypothetical protein
VWLAEAFALAPAGTVTGVVSGVAEREAAFRFVENEKIKASAIADSHHAATARRVAGQRVVIVAVDQTSLTLSDTMGKEGFGSTGPTTKSRRKRGFQVMNALAVDETGTTVGLLAQDWWSRLKKSPVYKSDRRPANERESDLWLRAVSHAQQVLGSEAPNTQAWFQFDRGADFWAMLSYAVEQSLLVTVRSAHDRTLADGRKLRESMKQAPLKGSYEALSSKHRRMPKAPL